MRRAFKALFSILCLLAFLARQCGAQQLLVTNDNASGPGSLSDAFSQAAPGSIIGFSGVDGNIAPGSALSAPGNLTINAANTTALNIPDAVSLNGSLTMNMAGQSGAISGTLSDGASPGTLNVMDSVGGGALTLSGQNTYTGGTFINSNVSLRLGAQNALGTGMVILNSGAGRADLNLQGNSQSIGSLSGDVNSTIELGAGALTVNSNANTTFSGVISDGGAGGSLVKNGLGILTLNASLFGLANTYSGGTTINSGILSVANDSDLGAASGGLTFNGGTLQTLAAFSSARAVSLQAGGGTIDVNGKAVTLSGAITGAGGLSLQDGAGGGVLTLTNGGNSYGGPTTLNSGILSVDNDSELGGALSGIVFNGGTLRVNNNNGGAGLVSARSITLQSGGTFDAFGLSSVLSGTISGSGGLTLQDSAGGGKIQLTGDSTYSGGTTVTGVTLGVGHGDSLGTGQVTLSGSTLQAGSSFALGNAVSLAGSGTLDAEGFAVTLSGPISGSGALTLQDSAGNGTIALAGNNTYSGGTTINSAAVQISAASAFGTGAVAFTGGSLSLGNGLSLANGITLNSAASMATSGAATLSGAISGSGSLTFTGGNFTLSGGNSYSGGTTISGAGETISLANDQALGSGTIAFQGLSGTLMAQTPVTVGNNISLANGAYALDAAGTVSTFSGAISGSGALTLEDSRGGGELLLSGNNSYSGGTVVAAATKVAVMNSQALGSGPIALNGGTLQTPGSGIDLTNGITLSGGGTIDAAGNNSTFSGVIAGSGGLTITDSSGGGQVALFGNNTYSGGTLINGSATSLGPGGVSVVTGGANVLGGGAVTMIGGANGSAALSLGNNQTIGSLSGDSRSQIELSNAALTTGGDNSSTAYAGSINDSGGSTLIKTGNGTFTLSGAWNVGSTVVNAGTLQLGANSDNSGAMTVNPGAALDLNGFSQLRTGAVVNNGTIKAGAGVLGASSYSGSGTLAVTLQPSVTNLVVAGNANVSGQTLSILGHAAPGNYTVISAGTLTGRFSAIDLPLGYADIATYTGSQLILDILAGSTFSRSAQTPNQSAIGGALDAASFGASGDMATVVTRLSAMPVGQLNAALDQIGPVSLAAIGPMSYAASSLQSSALRQRMSGLQAGAMNPDGGRLAYFTVGGKPPSPGTLVASGFDDSNLWNLLESPPGESPWGFFASAMGTTGRLDSSNNGSGSQPGYSFHSAGATLGADCRTSDSMAVGISGGYVNSSADIASDGGSLSSQSLRLGAYGTSYSNGFHVDFYMGGAKDFFNTSRNIALLSRVATASPKGEEFNLDAQADYDLEADPVVVTPYLGMSYDRLTVQSFGESGAGALDLSVAQQTAKSLRSSLGAKLSHSFAGEHAVTPYVSLGWQHEFVSQSRPIEAQFASGGAEFAVETANMARDGALLGAGVSMNLGDKFSARLAYAGQMRADFVSNSLSGALRWMF